MKIKNINKHVLTLFILSLLLIFPNLGKRNLGGDEVATAIYAENILINGEFAITETYEEPYYKEMGDKGWGYDFGTSFYILSFFYFLFGISDFVARLPFAIFGVFTIIVFYHFCKYFFKNEKKAFLCSLLLLLNYIFLISIRQARYYSMVMFLAISLVFSYLKIIENKGRFFSIPFILSNIAFFYIHTQLWFYIAMSLMIHFFAFIRDRKKFHRIFCNSLVSCIFMLVGLIPLVFWKGGFSRGLQIHGLLRILFNIALAYFYYFLLFFPLVFLLLIFFVKSLRKNIFENKRLALILSIIVCVPVVYSFITHSNAPQTRKLASMLLPFFTILTFSVFYHLFHKKGWRWVSISLLIVFLSSNILLIAPLYPLKFLKIEEKISLNVSYEVGFVEKSLRLRYETPQYFYELFSDYQSIDQSLIKGFEENGLLDCNCSIITDLEFNLNYHFIKKDLKQRFFYWSDEHKQMISNFSIIVVNHESNKQIVEEMFNEGILNVSEYEHFTIDDYQESKWIDHPMPIHRRIRKSDKGKIDVCYKKDLKK